jgi:hypothetical protein
LVSAQREVPNAAAAATLPPPCGHGSATRRGHIWRKEELADAAVVIVFGLCGRSDTPLRRLVGHGAAPVAAI